MNADGEAFTGIVSYTRANSVCDYQKLLNTFNGELGKSLLLHQKKILTSKRMVVQKYNN